MKLISFCHEDDYGHDFYVIIARAQRRSLFQIAFGTAIYGFTPRFSIAMGEGALFSISTALWKVYFTVEFIGYNWRG